ncbi:MAG TPA: pyridoxamine 5'-phosphate oxidase family protein, partial [Candidatus Dormibacteraeota bacterium]
MRTDRPESANIVEVLERAECERLLASHDIGRIAFSLGGVPEIFPVNYASDGSTVVFLTSEGTRLA